MKKIVKGVEVKYLTPSGSKIPIPCRLTYNASDPLALQLTLLLNTEGLENTWYISRELLFEGVNMLSGYGDVKVWPDLKHEKIYISLSSKDTNLETREALLETKLSDIIQFLTSTFLTVPLNEEFSTPSSKQSIENELNELLENAAA